MVETVAYELDGVEQARGLDDSFADKWGKEKEN